MALPDDCRLRLDRAWEHVESLKAEIAAFENLKPYGICEERDSRVGRHVYYFEALSPVPKHLGLLLENAPINAILPSQTGLATRHGRHGIVVPVEHHKIASMRVEVVVQIEKVRYEQMSACADALSLLEGLKTKWTIEGETPFYGKGGELKALATARVIATVDAPSEAAACEFFNSLIATAVRGGNAQAALKSTPINTLEPITAEQITCKSKAV